MYIPIFSKLVTGSVSVLIIITLLSGCRKEKNEPAVKTPGGVTGIIQPASAVLSVSIVSIDGKHTYSTTPDSTGVFMFADIPQGDYTFKATVSSIYHDPGNINFTVPEFGITTLKYILLKYNPSEQTGVITFTLDSVKYTISADSLKYSPSNFTSTVKGNTPYNPDYYRMEMFFNYLADEGSYSFQNSFFSFDLYYYQSAGSMLKEYWRIVDKGQSNKITITSNDKTKRSVSGTFTFLLDRLNSLDSKKVSGSFTNLRY